MQQQQDSRPEDSGKDHNLEDRGKIFVGGLSSETVEATLIDHFSTYGRIIDCIVMRDKITGKSRGFGFVSFYSEDSAHAAVADTHNIDGTAVEAKQAIPKSSMPSTKTNKVFVGGIPLTTQPSDFRAYFEKFGTVVDATLMRDKVSLRPRGFGFVTFFNEESVQNVLSQRHSIGGKTVDVKLAVPRAKQQVTPVIPTYLPFPYPYFYSVPTTAFAQPNNQNGGANGFNMTAMPNMVAAVPPFVVQGTGNQTQNMNADPNMNARFTNHPNVYAMPQRGSEFNQGGSGQQTPQGQFMMYYNSPQQPR